MSQKEKHLEIVNNVVWEVKKVREDTGIIAYGEDREGTKYTINNVDAGNSVALMKVAMNGKRKKTNIGVVTILMGTGITVIFFVLVLVGYNRMTAKPEPKIPQVFENVQLPENSDPIPLKNPEKEKEEEEKKDIENQKNNIEKERVQMQNSFMLESVKLEMQRKDMRIVELEQENKKLSENIILLENEKKDLSEIVRLYEEKKNSREGVIIQIGEYIDKVCRLNNTQECKDMYFNIIGK